MPSIVTFKNVPVVEPGSYAETKGAVDESSEAASYGNVCIIDTGSGAGYGGGAGINGEAKKGIDSVYEFNSLEDFRLWIRGGINHDVSPSLFKPSKDPLVRGCSKLYYVSAKTTTRAKANLVFTGYIPEIPEIVGVTEVVAYRDVTFNLGIETEGNFVRILVAGVVISSYVVQSGDTVSDVFDALIANNATTWDISFISGLTIRVSAPVGVGAAANGTVVINSVVGPTGGYSTTSGMFGGVTAVTGVPAVPASSAGGGVIEIGTLAEGSGANGVVTSSLLRTGFSMKMISGTDDTSKFILQFWRGTYKGLDANGIPFDGVSEVDSEPVLICQTPEFNNMSEIVDYFKTDFIFTKWFELLSSSVTGDGSISQVDLDSNSSLILFSGGTETYNASDLDDVLDAISELDNTFFLADKTGDLAKSTENSKIFAHINLQAEYEKFLIIGGGKDDTKFDSTSGTISIAEYYDSPKVHTIHSDIQNIVDNIYKRYSTYYHAAKYCGLIAGQSPQVTGTFKALDLDGIIHKLSKKQREFALKKGVVHERRVDGRWVINQDVNTLQKNTQMIYPEGISPEGSIMRISALLNKELVINTRKKFVGGNTNTVSATDVRNYIISYLEERTANKVVDNLILKFSEIKVSLFNGDFKISYKYQPNGPINRLFITGFMLNISQTA
jgi:hypothetical protein